MEDDIHRSIKYEIWCSTDHGNKRLDDAFKERQKNGGKVLLFFSVNGSGHFCGMAQMMTEVDYNCTSSVWSQDKWKGKFKVKWIYVKDVPNIKFRHIRLENNENKSVTNSRDAQEVPNARVIEVLQILHDFKHVTSIFDDFNHYEKKQKEVSSKKPLSAYDGNNMSSHMSPVNRPYGRPTDDRDFRGGGSQKYFTAGSTSGGGGSGLSGGYRERCNNLSNRVNNGGYYSGEHRRYDNHRATDRDSDALIEKERERENNSGGDYGNRYAQKFDSNRRIDEQQQQRIHIRHNNRERDLSEEQQEQQNTESRFRTAP